MSALGGRGRLRTNGQQAISRKLGQSRAIGLAEHKVHGLGGLGGVAVAIAFATSAAMAQPYGYGMMGGYGPGMMHGYGPHLG